MTIGIFKKCLEQKMILKKKDSRNKIENQVKLFFFVGRGITTSRDQAEFSIVGLHSNWAVHDNRQFYVRASG